MRDETLTITERLRALKILGKSQGDFLERVHHTGDVKMTTLAQALREVDKTRGLPNK